MAGPAERLDVRSDRVEALRRFDDLGAVDPDEMFGRWRGSSYPTGHPLDGVLDALGWYGKTFEPPDLAYPLLFRNASGGLVALDPSFLPANVPLHWPGLSRSLPARAAFAAMRPLLTTRRPSARLRRVSYRGLESTAMVYDSKPITDHFRRIAPNEVLGVMEMAGAAPYFFRLVRDFAPDPA